MSGGEEGTGQYFDRGRVGIVESEDNNDFDAAPYLGETLSRDGSGSSDDSDFGFDRDAGVNR